MINDYCATLLGGLITPPALAELILAQLFFYLLSAQFPLIRWSERVVALMPSSSPHQARAGGNPKRLCIHLEQTLRGIFPGCISCRGFITLSTRLVLSQHYSPPTLRLGCIQSEHIYPSKEPRFQCGGRVSHYGNNNELCIYHSQVLIPPPQCNSLRLYEIGGEIKPQSFVTNFVDWGIKRGLFKLIFRSKLR